MAEINVNGRMLVKNFKKQFKEAFGCSLRVYVKTHFADENQTLASLREEGKKGGELSVKGNMLVGNFEAKMLEEYGITVQVANIDDTKLVDNNLTLAAAGRGEERKTVKKTEKVASDKPEADTPKPTTAEQPKTAQPAEGEKKQFQVVLTGKAIYNMPVNFHEDCNGTTLNCYNSIEIWEDFYSANPLDWLSDGVIERYTHPGTTLIVSHVKISGITGEGVEFDSDATFKIEQDYTCDKPCTNDGYVAIIECKFTDTMKLELSDALDFDLSKLNFKYDDDYEDYYYDGKPINADFNVEVSKLIGYTDGEKKYEHCYEAPVTLKELVDKYQGAVLEISLIVEREDGFFASDEDVELYDNNHWKYKIEGPQLVDTWTSDRFDIHYLEKPCFKEEMANKLAVGLDFWRYSESGYDIEACVYETDEDGNYINLLSRNILLEAWS